MSLMDIFVSPFVDFVFVRRALTGCVALAMGSSPLGVLLLLRRMGLMGDAMSHAILPGAALGYLFFGLSLPAMTIGGVTAGLIVATLAGLVTRYTTLKEDASFAAFYLISLALGVMIISLRGTSLDILHMLFGTVLSLDNHTLVLAVGIASFSMLMLALFYRPILVQCFDPNFLATRGRWSLAAYGTFLLLLVFNLVGGFYTLGTLMAVAFMVLPAAAARFWTATVSTQMIVAAIIGALCGYLGLLASFHFNATAASPAIVLTMGGAYVLSMFLGSYSGLLWRLRRRSRA